MQSIFPEVEQSTNNEINNANDNNEINGADNNANTKYSKLLPTSYIAINHDNAYGFYKFIYFTNNKYDSLDIYDIYFTQEDTNIVSKAITLEYVIHFYNIKIIPFNALFYDYFIIKVNVSENNMKYAELLKVNKNTSEHVAYISFNNLNIFRACLRRYKLISIEENKLRDILIGH